MPLSSDHIHERLRQAARRYRWLGALRHTLSGVACGLALMTVLLLADSHFHFGGAARWIAFLAVILPVLAGIAYGLYRALPRISEASMARRVEAAADGSRNTLISAVQFDRELPLGSAFREAIFQEMTDPFPRVKWSLVFDLRLFKRLAAALGVGLLILSLYATLRPHYFANSAARILFPARAIPPLTHTRIATLTPGDTRVINGRPLRVTARLEGEIPAAVWIASREAGGPWQKAVMDREVGSDLFTFQWKELHDPLAYRVIAGDAVSPVHQAAVRPRTALIHRRADIQAPAYTGLPPETRKDFAALQNILPGSRITLTFEFNAPLEDLRTDAPLALTRVTPTQWTASGVLKTNTPLRLQWHDTDALADSEVIQLAVAPDEPPRLTVTTPPEGKEIVATAQDALPITFQATDNFALASVALYRSTDENPEAERLAEWKEAANKKAFSATYKIPLAKYAKEGRVTFALVAKDKNNVTGPGVTWSRPLVVTLRNQDQVDKAGAEIARQTFSGLEALIKAQTDLLEQTQAAFKALAATPPGSPALRPLLERQSQLAETAEKLAADLTAEPQTALRSLTATEFPAAILALRNAATAPGPQPAALALTQAIAQESVILAKLQGLLKAAAAEAVKAKIQDLISGVEDLLRRQRELLRATGQAHPADALPLSQRQDALAEKAASVRKNLERGSQDATSGDADFRDRLAKAAAGFKEAAVYEKMLTASEQLQAQAFPAAVPIEQEVVARLAKLAESLNQWQLAAAKHEADALKEQARDLTDKLKALAELQKGVIEKSKELSRKGDARPEDAATADALQKARDQVAQTVEQMLTDAHLFPDIKPYNELRGELTQIYEDVIQQDKEEAMAGKLKATEIAVQKEESLLKDIEKTEQISEDLEMWLPNKNDAEKWLCENFDKTEMPDIPNLPLPDAFEDLVGDLLTEQQGLEQEAMDAASNQALAQAQQGWGVADGPMPGFSAQGKSGNTRPNQNEQNGRSSGGREGMSNGEMVGSNASNLEGSKTKTRRTNDPMGQGHVEDNGGIQPSRATGGGKSGGFSDRNGMDGNAPLRATNAPRMAANDALAVKEALLSEKTSKMYAQASLLYLKARGLPGVARLMDESQAALKEGRLEDFRNLHQRIVTQLKEVQGGIVSGNASPLTGGDRVQSRDKALLGGDEGQAPVPYQKAVIDYYRSIQDEK
ncbi:MAG: hypothetical protein ACFUZC_01585 [Chthoniobacteraceae bacterium]